jgi:HSP20 family protein
MNLMRTRETRALPVAGNAFEPFRLMRNFLRWDPYRDFGFPEDLAASSFMPSFDVQETADAYVFTADMPGIRREDLEIELAGNRLTLSGKREHETSQAQATFYTQERSYGAFSRTFTLPEEVESAKVVAELRDGVLHLMVPKSPEVRPQKITIG